MNPEIQAEIDKAISEGNYTRAFLRASLGLPPRQPVEDQPCGVDVPLIAVGPNLAACTGDDGGNVVSGQDALLVQFVQDGEGEGPAR